MQLELDVAPQGPRVLALCVPDVCLQRLARARERGGAPVAVVAEGRVVACSPAARACGVRTGDSALQAEAACVRLEVVAHDPAADRAALESLAEAMLALGPAVEISAPDAVLVDASAAHLAAGDGEPEAGLADRARALAAALGFHARAAVASGRGPARALARFGAGAHPIAPGRTAAALATLPLQAVDLPDAIAARLRAVGIVDLGGLARLPAAGLAQRFGAAGAAAWRLARGDDPTPLAPWIPAKLPTETIELDAPVETAEPLLFALKRLCDRVASRLAGRGLGASRLELVLRLDPGGEERVSIALAVPSAAPSRWILVLRERLGGLRLGGAVLSARLEAADAAPVAPEQLALGDRPEQLAALDAVLARLAARLGEQTVFAAEPVERHRPEGAYRPAPFRGRSAGARASTASAPAELEPVCSLPRPTRLLPTPVPLVAEGEGGRVTALRLDGRAFPVVAMSSPERLAGEWWSAPFDREYRRVRLDGLGECWIFRDVGSGRLWLHGFFD